MPRGPANFRSTVVKPYHHGPEPDLSIEFDRQVEPEAEEPSQIDTVHTPVHTPPTFEIQIDNRAFRAPDQIAKRGRGRPRIESQTQSLADAFISQKEQVNRELSLQLRQEGKITAAGEPFEASDQQEIDDLITRGVFTFQQYDSGKHGGIRIFKSRLMREIKLKAINKFYKKLKLIV